MRSRVSNTYSMLQLHIIITCVFNIYQIEKDTDVNVTFSTSEGSKNYVLADYGFLVQLLTKDDYPIVKTASISH